MWMSKRQTCIALSSTESEYIALAHAGKESVWLARLISEICGSSNTDDAICIKTDSQSAIRIANNPEHHDKTKHIDIRHHYIRWLVDTKRVILEHLPDTEQPADILTKSVVKENFVKKRDIMGMQPPPAATMKRKALSSIIVDPKRPNLFWSLTMLLLLFFKLGGADDVHSTGSPVLWRRSHEPVVTGFNAVMMTIKLVSPCELIPIDGVESRIATTIQLQCDKTYRGLFLSTLEKICPRQKSIFKRNKRNKREPISIGIVIVAVIASAGVGIGAWGVTRTYAIETKEEELKIALDDLEKKVFSGEKQIEFLQDEVRKVTSILDQLVADFTLYREKVVELQYLIAYLTGKLMEGRKALHETEKSWKKG